MHCFDCQIDCCLTVACFMDIVIVNFTICKLSIPMKGSSSHWIVYFRSPHQKKVIYSIDRILNKVRNELKYPHTILLAPLAVPPQRFRSFSQHLCSICSCSQEFSPDWKEMMTHKAVWNIHYWTKHSGILKKKQLILSEKEFREGCPKEAPLWTKTWIMNRGFPSKDIRKEYYNENSTSKGM